MKPTGDKQWSSLMGEMAGSTVNEHGLLNDIEGNRELCSKKKCHRVGIFFL